MLVVGEIHVVHDEVINSGIHDLVAANGAVPLPLDCYPVDEAAPALRCVHWAGAGETLRASLAAAAAGDVFPLLLCAYGCGPNSLVEHLFDDLLADYPHTVLESDGHGGSAGYVTRVQAFLHAVQGYRDARAAAPAPRSRRRRRADDGAGPVASGRPHRLERCERPVAVSLRTNRERTFLFGNIGGSGGRFAAAAMRGAGLDARSVGPTSPAALDKAPPGLLGQGVPALPAHLGHAGRLPRPCRRHHRRGRSRVRQHRPRLSGLPGQPVPGGPADPARAPRLRRRRRGGRLHAALRGLVADLGGVGRLGGRRPAQHDALLPLRHRAPPRRRGRPLPRLRRPPRGAAGGAPPDRQGQGPERRARAAVGLRGARRRGRRASSRRCRAAAVAPTSCARSFCAATSTCGSTSGATTSSSASSPTRACASSSNRSARSSSCSPCATRASTA